MCKVSIVKHSERDSANSEMCESTRHAEEVATTLSGDEARFVVDEVTPIGSFQILMAFHVPAMGKKSENILVTVMMVRNFIAAARVCGTYFQVI